MFSIEFNTDNAAFEDNEAGELAYVLKQVTQAVDNGLIGGQLMDSNGNYVGRWDKTTMPETKPVRKVCSTCGSEDVKADAWAEWNPTTQQWEISAVMDGGSFCSQCDGECRIEDQEVAP